MDSLFKAYEGFARVAMAILVCHHDSIVDASKLKFSETGENNPPPEYNKDDYAVLEQTCGKMMKDVTQADKARRAALMGALVDLMVYDLAK